MEQSPERARKRRRLSKDDNEDHETNNRKLIFESLSRPVSPPPFRSSRPSAPKSPQLLKSPFQLTWITDLAESSNVDALSLKDVLGDPLISECWEFNYLHDLRFLMDAFDPDIRDLVKVHVIHGFWKNEDQSRLSLVEQAAKYANLKLHAAYMPEMFGTHHSKMIILIRHDDTAQVIIHTANMIPFDWTNMTQAVWRSPVLPKITSPSKSTAPGTFGSGTRFKDDLLNYLKAYDNNRAPRRPPICAPLVEELSKYDFSEVRGALVASVPSRQGIETNSKTCWGWPGLKNVLSAIPTVGKEPEIVVQISSIATLGPTDKWLDKTFFKTLSASRTGLSKPKFRIIFPTADEIRRSLNGYASGSAIHTRLQSAQQVKQLQYLKPMLCHWAGDGAQHPQTDSPMSDAGRKRAAPHIKTYTRFTDSTRTAIDWMLVTSANLSKQAWGDATTTTGDVRVCSYEIGVLVWPEIFGEKATIVPTFKTDTPTITSEMREDILVVGARLPYDLPIMPYGKDDVPWCATSSYQELDWLGRSYNASE